jgi:hypothetical protein
MAENLAWSIKFEPDVDALSRGSDKQAAAKLHLGHQYQGQLAARFKVLGPTPMSPDQITLR